MLPLHAEVRWNICLTTDYLGRRRGHVSARASPYLVGPRHARSIRWQPMHGVEKIFPCRLSPVKCGIIHWSERPSERFQPRYLLSADVEKNDPEHLDVARTTECG